MSLPGTALINAPYRLARGVGTDADPFIPNVLPAPTDLVGASFTRPADTTAYAVGDLVSNSTTAGSVAALEFTVIGTAGDKGTLDFATIRKTGTGVANAAFRLHLFKDAPATITNGDNGAFSVSGAADYVGALDIVVDRALTDGAFGRGLPVIGIPLPFECATGVLKLFGHIEARGAYSPALSEVFYPVLGVSRR
jgi:hypothetical protein